MLELSMVTQVILTPDRTSNLNRASKIVANRLCDELMH
jgi:hypothetical protein